MLPCSPLISYKDLIKASKFFKKKQVNSLIAVSKYPCPIEWAYSMDKNNLLTPINAKSHAINSQSFKIKYFDSGTFSIFSKSYFKKKRNIYKNFYGYKIDLDKAIDIDNLEDWSYAKKTFRKNILKKGNI